ncbi:MAG TPA: shikimate dehydrogenase [Acidimicrobiales bacterium]
MVDAHTTLVGVMGDPVRHSLSPLLHNSAFDALGLNWTSLAFEVPTGQAASAVEGIRGLGLAGMSVTMPHKADVAVLMDELSPTAEQLGAVNCVARRDGMLRGESTDGAGFLASLHRSEGFEPQGTRCVVLGAGGAARAVMLALAEAGAAEVVVINRTEANAAVAAALAGKVGRSVAPSDTSGVKDALAAADLVVNATPLGMVGQRGTDDWLVDPSLLRSGRLAADLIYVPRATPWLTAAASAGVRTVGGLGMLVHQAAAQIELWTGQPAPVEAMWSAVAE